MLTRRAWSTALTACALTVGACDTSLPGTEGDCTARVRYEGVLYRPHNELPRSAPSGPLLGTGEVVGCGDLDSARAVDEVAVTSVRGVDGSIAVMVAAKEWRGIYVAEGLTPAAWPRPLRSP